MILEIGIFLPLTCYYGKIRSIMYVCVCAPWYFAVFLTRSLSWRCTFQSLKIELLVDTKSTLSSMKVQQKPLQIPSQSFASP